MKWLANWSHEITSRGVIQSTVKRLREALPQGKAVLLHLPSHKRPDTPLKKPLSSAVVSATHALLLANCPEVLGISDVSWLAPTLECAFREFAHSILPMMR